MKRYIFIFIIAIGLAGALPAMPSSTGLLAQNNDDGETEDMPDNGWPYVIKNNGNNITMYQPQVESWKGNILKARSAVSLTTRASAQPSYGVIFFKARTDVDHSSGTVALEGISIESVSFPKNDTDSIDYYDIIKASVPDWPQAIALNRLLADLAIARAEMKTQQQIKVKNDPPRFFFSTKPAVLVLIDGTPVPRPLGGTSFMKIINTRALILLDTANGIYYMYLTDHWEEARNIEGAWAPSKNPPEALAAILNEERQSKTSDLLLEKNKKTNVKTTGPLTVFISTRPAELVITKGKPNLQMIEGTRLLFCSNSDNDIFFYLNDQQFYLLAAGRWYRGKTLEKGPWEFVHGSSLPKDFANIPENHRKGTVLVSVPGTHQSKEAVISNSIPQTASVKRDMAKANITYDGDPVFKPIRGTPLAYAVNTPVPVIRVDDKGFYSVVNGVWFSAASPFGPWEVTDMVPSIIYTIPPSCPIHYVVYVRVYGSTPDIVYVGYLPGYYGMFIGTDGTVVFGTGYLYDPWIGAVWYGAPVTWGTGICFGWYAWGWGWQWGYYYGWRPLFRPWWGPMWGWSPYWWPSRGWRRGAYVHFDAYRHWSGRTVVQRSLPTTGNPHMVPRQANDHFAGHDGRVYRRNMEGRWERNMGGDRWIRHDRETRGYEDGRSLRRYETSRGGYQQGAHQRGGHQQGGRQGSRR